ncbi:hypothetical protein CEUSTIGMA_g8588.t1 [Chlamydomonas eustigma]|uniref:SET domain-containing protein n=1 Tax=Chlamydomonas eustigma TaxID=1157962 RepID=A0A250XDK1_9CHLO|nr:hypothetical protein CEUSTIGMA_g8588.t1 [Chlamydomonas eustigma]|eukprot:GAX81155.1 hypothetical protein CEUSTIGMA_g8588.t1 [Chlamydomonas eustigma]
MKCEGCHFHTTRQCYLTFNADEKLHMAAMHLHDVQNSLRFIRHQNTLPLPRRVCAALPRSTLISRAQKEPSPSHRFRLPESEEQFDVDFAWYGDDDLDVMEEEGQEAEQKDVEEYEEYEEDKEDWEGQTTDEGDEGIVDAEPQGSLDSDGRKHEDAVMAALKLMFTAEGFTPECWQGPIETRAMPGARGWGLVASEFITMGQILLVAEPSALVRGKTIPFLLARNQQVASGSVSGSIYAPEVQQAVQSAPTSESVAALLSARQLDDAWVRHSTWLLAAGVGNDGRRNLSRVGVPPPLDQFCRDVDSTMSGGKHNASRVDKSSSSGLQENGRKRYKGQRPASPPAAVAVPDRAPEWHDLVPTALDVGQLDIAASVGLQAEYYQDPASAVCRGEPVSPYAGIWPELALANHSCLPNAMCILVGDRMVMRAVRDIVPDDEVTISYLAPAGLSGTGPLRRAELKASYGFKCTCIRCKVESFYPKTLGKSLTELHQAALMLRAELESLLSRHGSKNQGAQPATAVPQPDSTTNITDCRATTSQLIADENAVLGDIVDMHLLQLPNILPPDGMIVEVPDDIRDVVLRIEGEGHKLLHRYGEALSQVQIQPMHKASIASGAMPIYELMSACSEVLDHGSMDHLKHVQACLEAAETVAPGTELHTLLSAKLSALLQNSFGTSDARARQALRECMNAHISRYGAVSGPTLAQLVSASMATFPLVDAARAATLVHIRDIAMGQYIHEEQGLVGTVEERQEEKGVTHVVHDEENGTRERKSNGDEASRVFSEVDRDAPWETSIPSTSYVSELNTLNSSAKEPRKQSSKGVNNPKSSGKKVLGLSSVSLWADLPTTIPAAVGNANAVRSANNAEPWNVSTAVPGWLDPSVSNQEGIETDSWGLPVGTRLRPPQDPLPEASVSVCSSPRRIKSSLKSEVVEKVVGSMLELSSSESLSSARSSSEVPGNSSSNSRGMVAPVSRTKQSAKLLAGPGSGAKYNSMSEPRQDSKPQSSSMASINPSVNSTLGSATNPLSELLNVFESSGMDEGNSRSRSLVAKIDKSRGVVKGSRRGRDSKSSTDVSNVADAAEGIEDRGVAEGRQSREGDRSHQKLDQPSSKSEASAAEEAGAKGRFERSGEGASTCASSDADSRGKRHSKKTVVGQRLRDKGEILEESKFSSTPQTSSNTAKATSHSTVTQQAVEVSEVLPKRGRGRPPKPKP